nr:RHS repeat-associated core domain-containing protein [Pseudomonas laurentiana]
MHYNRYRYYDPLVGRFISKDPIGYAGGLNLYVYAPNPVFWIDPFGLAADCYCGSGGYFSGVSKPRSVGAAPNSIYTKTNKDKTVAVQNTVYDEHGRAIGQVDFKNHGKGAASGHSHLIKPPGNLAAGHGPDATHIEPSKVPLAWGKIPAGMKPSTPIGE